MYRGYKSINIISIWKKISVLCVEFFLWHGKFHRFQPKWQRELNEAVTTFILVFIIYYHGANRVHGHHESGSTAMYYYDIRILVLYYYIIILLCYYGNGPETNCQSLGVYYVAVYFCSRKRIINTVIIQPVPSFGALPHSTLVIHKPSPYYLFPTSNLPPHQQSVFLLLPTSLLLYIFSTFFFYWREGEEEESKPHSFSFSLSFHSTLRLVCCCAIHQGLIALPCLVLPCSVKSCQFCRGNMDVTQVLEGTLSPGTYCPTRPRCH